MTDSVQIRCPDELRLRDYVTGRLVLPEHVSIEEHVDSCHDCGSTVAELDGATRTILANQSREAPEVDDELRQLVALAKPIWQGSRSAERDDEASPLAAGTRLGNYEIVDLIGTGGMGHVHRARHLHMNREVAIKVVSPRMGESHLSAERFRREIEAAGRVQHPNVVAAYDAGDVDGRFYLAMEFVDGCDLEAVVEETGPLSVAEAINVLEQAAQGLQAAHAAGLVHRDVKPSNLIRANDGVVKVADLGLSRAVEQDEAGPRLTSSGMLMGTAAYLAPEQAADPRAAGAPADVYGLGCTLFHLLTGRALFEGRTAMDVVFAHREQPVPRLSETVSESPKWLDDLLSRMLEKQPETRATIADVLAALPNGAPTPTRATPARATRSQRRTVLIATAVSAVLLISAAFAWLPRDRDSERLQHAIPPDTDSLLTIWQDDPRSDATVREPTKPLLAMIPIPAGTFTMGAGENDAMASPNERPRHAVRLTKRFQLASHEVTREQWIEVMGRPPRIVSTVAFDPESPEDAETSKISEPMQLPAVGLSWRDAIAFCNALSKREGLDPFYEVTEESVAIRGGNGYRLPTEAEWEYACRAGTETRWSFGDDAERLGEFAWFANNAVGEPKPVGTRKPNPWGLFDMHGNAPEWCWDRFSPDYYARSEPINPAGSTTGMQRVFRGGSVNDAPHATRSSARSPLGTSYGGFTNPVGLRVARNLD